MYIMSSCCFNYSILLRKLLNQSLDVLKPLENNLVTSMDY